jgi:uncharacterized repeat protein (TIGR02543 family)
MVGNITTANAWSATGGYVYFDASGWDTSSRSVVQLFVGNDSYTSCYTMTKIDNTDLYAYKMGSWSNYGYIAFVASSSGWGDGSYGYSNVTSNSGTITYAGSTSNLPDLKSSTYYLFTKSSTSNGASLSYTSSTSYSGIQYTQTVTAQVSDDGSSYSNASTAPAKITATTYRTGATDNFTKSYTATATITSGSSTVTANSVVARTAPITYHYESLSSSYEFVGWYSSSGTLISNSNDYTVSNTTGDTTVYARFKKLASNYTLKIGGAYAKNVAGTAYASSTTAGTFEVTYNGTTITASNGTSGVSLPENTEVTLKATANDGYTFAGWAEGATSTSANVLYTSTNTSFKLTSNTTLYPRFDRVSYSVTSSATDCTINGLSSTYVYGATVSFTVSDVPDGYTLSVSSDEVTIKESSGTYSFTMPAKAVTITAKAVDANQYQSVSLESTSPTGGTASISGGGTKIKYGTDVTFTANPNAGYTFAGWYYTNANGNEVKLSSDTTYAYSAGYKDQDSITIRAKFSVITPTIQMTKKNSSGSDITVDEGTTAANNPYSTRDESSVTIKFTNYADFNGAGTFKLYANSTTEVTDATIVTTTDSITYTLTTEKLTAYKNSSGNINFTVVATVGTDTATSGNIALGLVNSYKVTNGTSDNGTVEIQYYDAYGDSHTLAEGEYGYARSGKYVTVTKADPDENYLFKSINANGTAKDYAVGTAFSNTSDTTYTVTFEEKPKTTIYVLTDYSDYVYLYTFDGNDFKSIDTTQYESTANDKKVYKSYRMNKLGTTGLAVNSDNNSTTTRYLWEMSYYGTTNFIIDHYGNLDEKLSGDIKSITSTGSYLFYIANKTQPNDTGKATVESFVPVTTTLGAIDSFKAEETCDLSKYVTVGGDMLSYLSYAQSKNYTTTYKITDSDGKTTTLTGSNWTPTDAGKYTVVATTTIADTGLSADSDPVTVTVNKAVSKQTVNYSLETPSSATITGTYTYNGGTATSFTSGTQLKQGSVVTITVSLKDGYTFSGRTNSSTTGWYEVSSSGTETNKSATDDGSITATTYTFTVGTSDKTLVYKTKAINYSVTPVVDPLGAATLEFTTTDDKGITQLNVGDEFTVTYTGNDQYAHPFKSFVATYNNGTTLTAKSTTSNSATYVMPAYDVSLTANFGTVNYYVVGKEGLTGSDWVVNDSNNLMTSNGDGTFSKTYTGIEAGTYEYKITDGQWNTDNDKTHSFPTNSTNKSITATQNGATITITFNPTTQDITYKISYNTFVVNLVANPAGSCTFEDLDGNTLGSSVDVDKDKGTVVVVKPAAGYTYSSNTLTTGISAAQYGNYSSGFTVTATAAGTFTANCSAKGYTVNPATVLTSLADSDSYLRHSAPGLITTTYKGADDDIVYNSDGKTISKINNVPYGTQVTFKATRTDEDTTSDTVEGDDGSDDTESVDAKTTTANNGFVFKGWFVSDTAIANVTDVTLLSTEDTYTYTVTSDTTQYVYALYDRDTVQVEWRFYNHGTVTKSGDVVNEGNIYGFSVYDKTYSDSYFNYTYNYTGSDTLSDQASAIKLSTDDTGLPSDIEYGRTVTIDNLTSDNGTVPDAGFETKYRVYVDCDPETDSNVATPTLKAAGKGFKVKGSKIIVYVFPGQAHAHQPTIVLDDGTTNDDGTLKGTNDYTINGLTTNEVLNFVVSDSPYGDADDQENLYYQYVVDKKNYGDQTKNTTLTLNSQDLGYGTHTISVKAVDTSGKYATSYQAAKVTVTINAPKVTLTVPKVSDGITSYTVVYYVNDTKKTATIKTKKEYEVDQGSNVVVTANLTDADKYAVNKWYVNTDEIASSDSSYTVKDIQTDTTVYATALGAITVDDYTLSSTWVKPTEQFKVTTTMTKAHDASGKSVSYSTIAYAVDSNGKIVMTSDSTTFTENNKGKKYSFDPVTLTASTVGKYTVYVEIYGKDSSGTTVAYGMLKDKARTVTVSNEDTKVSLTARLSLTSGLEGTVEENNDPAVEVMQGEKITLTGACKNGNTAAGDYTANCADQYGYDFYYYTDADSTPKKINSNRIIVTADTENTPVSTTSINYKIPSSTTVGTQYYFYVEITAYKGGEEISLANSSAESKGLVTANIVAATTKTPKWAESGRIYFHTIGDNDTDREAWAVAERDGQSKNTTIAIGQYSTSAGMRVYLPTTAENSDGTYTIFNNTDNDIYVGTAKTRENNTLVKAGSTGRVPSNSTMIFRGNNADALTINKSSAEENVYITTNGTATGADGKVVEDSAKSLVSALGLDGSKATKADSEIKSPTMTLVQSNGTIDFSAVGKNIKGRGNSTWTGTLKKSYNINTGTNCTVNGMAKNKKYSLLANFQDPSLIRNRLLYDLADSVGIPYATDSRFADLYVNGLYVGSYLLTEKYDSIEDLSEKITYTDDSKTEVSDMEFMIELAWDSAGEDTETVITRDSGKYLIITLPEMTEENSAVKTFIKSKFEALFTALNNSSTTRSQLEALIDVDSLAKVYLINELGKNWDAGVSSFYLTYQNGKFVASPVWDFDNALGNPNKTNSQTTEGWWFETNDNPNLSDSSNFVTAAANNKVVKQAAREAWFGSNMNDRTSFRYVIDNFANGSAEGTLGKNSGLQTAAYYKSVLEGSATSNYTKWNVIANDWACSHDTLNIWSVTDTNSSTDAYSNYLSSIEYTLETVDKETYKLASSSKSYTEGDVSNEIQYAIDFMTSRAVWLGYSILNNNNYYVIGDNFGGWELSNKDNRMTETYGGSGIYVLKDVDKSTINNSEKYWKLSDGTNFIGPNANVIFTSTNISTTNVNVGTYYASYQVTSLPSAWTTVDIFYDTVNGSVYLANHSETTFTAPSISVSPKTQAVEEDASAKITATITSGTKYSVDGGTQQDYTGAYVFKLYNSNAVEIDSIIATESATFTISGFSDSIYEYDYSVKAYPQQASNPSEVMSSPANAKVLYKYVIDTKDVKYYVDMHDNSGDPTLNFSDGTAKLTKEGDSTVYCGTYKTTYYYSSTDSNKTPVDLSSKLNSITVGSKKLAAGTIDVKCISTGEVWLEAITDTSTATEITENSQTQEPVYQETSIDYKRIYVSKGTTGWSNIYAYYWSNSNKNMTTWPGDEVTSEAGDDYYINIPKDATHLILNNGDNNNMKQTADASIGNYIAFYPEAKDGGFVLTPWTTQPVEPTLSKYIKTLSIANGDTYNIAPTATGTVTYTVTSGSGVVSVAADGTVTANKAGTAKISYTITGSSEDTLSGYYTDKYGTIETTVTVVQETKATKAFAVMSYRSATSTFSAKNGTVTSVTGEISGSAYTGTKGTGIISNSNGTYTVKYAIPNSVSGYTGIALKVTATAKPNSGKDFINWTKNNSEVSTNATETFTLTSSGTYVANCADSTVSLQLVYSFKDYNTEDGNYVYDANKETKEASYKPAALKVSPETVNDTTALKELVMANAPDIVSNYFTYNVDTNSLKASDVKGTSPSYTLTIPMTETVRKYEVTVNRGSKGSYTYQKKATFDSGKSNVYWYTIDEKGDKVVLSTDSSYTTLVTTNMDLYYEDNNSNVSVDGSSVITYAHSEIYYSNSTKGVKQNFYIQDFFDEDSPIVVDGTTLTDATNKTYLGSGVLMYTYNDNTSAPSKSAVKSIVNSDGISIKSSELLKAAQNVGYSKTHTAGSWASGTTSNGLSYAYFNNSCDGSDIGETDRVRYSVAPKTYSYIFSYGLPYNTSTYGKYSYVVYSYYVWSYVRNGSTYYVYEISDTYAKAKVLATD